MIQLCFTSINMAVRYFLVNVIISNHAMVKSIISCRFYLPAHLEIVYCPILKRYITSII